MQIFQPPYMNLKKLGKRLLYFAGGIVIVFVSAIILAVYFDDGGSWFSQSAFYLYIAILFGIGLFVVGLFPKLDEPRNTKEIPGKKPADTEDKK